VFGLDRYEHSCWCRNYCRKHCSKSVYGCKTEIFTGYEICNAHLVVPDYSLQIQLVFKAASRTILNIARCLANGTDPRVYHHDRSSHDSKACEKLINSRRDSTLPPHRGAHRQALAVRNPLDKYISGYKEVIKRNKYGMDLWRDNCTDQDNQRLYKKNGKRGKKHYTHSSLPQWMRTGADYSACLIDEGLRFKAYFYDVICHVREKTRFGVHMYGSSQTAYLLERQALGGLNISALLRVENLSVDLKELIMGSSNKVDDAALLCLSPQSKSSGPRKHSDHRKGLGDWVAAASSASATSYYRAILDNDTSMALKLCHHYIKDFFCFGFPLPKACLL